MRDIMKSPLFLGTMVLLLCLAICQVALPDQMQSDMENRPLKQAEPVTLSGVTTGRWMQSMETYVGDQFPFRDQWMYLQALWDTALLKNERNGILIGKEGWLYERCSNLDMKTAQDNARALNALGIWADIPVALMLVPLSSATNAYYLPNWVYPDDPDAMLDTLYALTPDLEAINILGRLKIASMYAMHQQSAQMYHRTDHHWSYDGAVVVYRMWALTMGVPLEDTALDPPAVVAGFKGTYFSRAPSLLIPAEAFAYDNPSDITLVVDDMKMATVHDQVALENPDVRDKYAQLLYGNRGRITLHNEAARGGTLVVLKDSYANAMLTMLARHYSRIEAIDLRYYAGDLLALLEETEAESILCMYGLTTFLSDRNILLHADAWGG